LVQSPNQGCCSRGVKRRLDKGKRTSRVERKELEKKKLAEVPPTALQNNLVMMAAKRAQEIQDA
jgi:hypothetical protein